MPIPRPPAKYISTPQDTAARHIILGQPLILGMIHDINLQLKAPWLEWVMTVGETKSVMMLKDQQIIYGTR